MDNLCNKCKKRNYCRAFKRDDGDVLTCTSFKEDRELMRQIKLEV